jgi:hypothetical protein
MDKSGRAFLIFVVSAAGWLSCFQPEVLGEGEPAAAVSANTPRAAPLLLLDDKPLLLDDGPGLTNAFTLLADNSRCHVCHVNYSMEQIAIQHARTNIGCATCHGPSDAHIADESWASGGNGTAPDILILKEKINPSCWACHELRKLSHKDHREFLWGVTDKNYCTDCHGQHRLPQRKCKWK